MPISPRTYQGEHDLVQMADLVRLSPKDAIHLVDLPYRLASWAFAEPDNCALWHDDQGEIIAWAVLQSPFWSIDYALHPGAPDGLLDQLLAWADQRARAIQHTQFGRPIWFANVFDWQHTHQRALEKAGFASQSNVGDNSWTKVLFGRTLNDLQPAPPIPPGFSIQPLHGPDDVAAYVALHRAVFESESMTEAWRSQTLKSPDYRQGLDLLMFDPGGQPAAFCIGWFAPKGRNGTPAGQIEPFGVRSDLRRLGVGRTLLLTCLNRMEELGIEHVTIETDNYRDAAYTFYQSLGFAVEHDILVYRKDYPEGDGR
jgi:ribosomal protein S18 acetylase RimI-like enzyme